MQNINHARMLALSILFWEYIKIYLQKLHGKIVKVWGSCWIITGNFWGFCGKKQKLIGYNTVPGEGAQHLEWIFSKIVGT